MIDKTKILIIEDDVKILNFLLMALKSKDYNIVYTNSGKEGMTLFCTEMPDILLLDLGLPDIDGNEIIQQIRKVSSLPILVISAREQERDKITALDLGANDYVTKPFSMGELLARIRVMERFVVNENITQPQNILKFGNLSIDIDSRIIKVNDREVHLTPIEFNILRLLIENRGKVVTHGQITKTVLGYDDIENSTNIRVHIAGLRRKLEDNDLKESFIQTEIGIGYKFNA